MDRPELKYVSLKTAADEDGPDACMLKEMKREVLGPDGSPLCVSSLPPTVQTPEDDEDVFFSWRVFFAYAGPGWLMSMAFLDPGNIESDLQAGAYGGYQLLWVLLGSTAIGFFLQILAARLGVVTGRSLAEICRDEYSRPMSLFIWVMVELAIIGSDIQEVIGSAIAFNILFHFPLWLGCLITGLDTFTFMGVHALGIRALELFFCAIVGVIATSFFVEFSISEPDIGHMARGLLLPSVSQYSVLQAVGIVGAIIMPHNVYLHSALVQSRSIDHSNPRKIRQANRYFALEALLALLVTFLINAAVLAVFAEGFFFEGCAKVAAENCACVPTQVALSNGANIYNFGDGGECLVMDGVIIGDCDRCHVQGEEGVCSPVGLADASSALETIFGSTAKVVWALGLLAAGQASTMTGTYAGQFVMEGFLNIKVAPWKRVLLTRSLALGPAVFVATATNANPSADDTMDELLNVLQSLLLPFALVPAIRFASDAKLVGEFQISRVVQVAVWLVGLSIIVVNIYLVVSFVKDTALHGSDHLVGLAVIMIGAVYLLVISSLMLESPLEFCRSGWYKLSNSRRQSNSTAEESQDELQEKFL